MLFSLMDSGAVLSRYDDGTEYKGMSACKSGEFCHLGQLTISGGWMKILRLLTLLLPRLWFFPYRTPHGPPDGPPAHTACVPPPPPLWQPGFCPLFFAWLYFVWIWNMEFWILSYGLKHLGTLGFHPSASLPSSIIISLLTHPKSNLWNIFLKRKILIFSQKP